MNLKAQADDTPGSELSLVPASDSHSPLTSSALYYAVIRERTCSHFSQSSIAQMLCCALAGAFLQDGESTRFSAYVVGLVKPGEMREPRTDPASALADVKVNMHNF